jgi:hypothetical protein
MKSKQTKALLATAALTGLLMGSDLRVSAATTSSAQQQTLKRSIAGTHSAIGLDDATTQPSHDCKGKNSCKGQGGCKTGDQGCKGKNSCKGNGGCKTASL